MKIFTEEEIKERKNKSIEVEATTSYSNDKYDVLNVAPLRPGNIFLYEKVSLSDLKSNSYKISYPKLAIYMDSYLMDQTLELEYKNLRRTWEYNTEYSYMYNYKEYTNIVADIRDIEYTILWNDTIHVFGTWDKMPNWKELKKAYRKTNWFRLPIDKERDIKIETLLRRSS